MKKLSTNLAIVIASGFFLSGCENSDYAAQSCKVNEKNTQPKSIDCTTPTGAIISTGDPSPEIDIDNSKGLQGKVFSTNYWPAAQVCFDNNLNARCDSELEITVISDEQGLYTLTKNALAAGLRNGSPLIAVLDNKIMSSDPATQVANSKPNNISPFTSLLVNEMLFSEASLRNADSARLAIAAKDVVLATPAQLAGEDYLATTNNNAETSDFIASFDAIQTEFNQLENTRNHYSVLAAIFNSMLLNNRFDITVGNQIIPSDIDAQSIINSAISAQLSSAATSWELGYADEKSRKISTYNDIAIVGSKWNNRLILLNTQDLNNSLPSLISSTKFAYVEGGKDKVDGISGATEQLLHDIDISPDERNVFVTVKKAKDDSKNLGVGIYRADIFSPQDIADTKFARQTENGVNYYAFPEINNAALSGDGEVLALASEKRSIAILNANTLAENSLLSLDSKVRSLVLDQAGKQVFAGLSRSSRTGIISLNIANQKENDFIASESYPTALQTFGDNLLAASFYKSAKLSLFDISDANNIIPLKNVMSSEAITSFSISNNGQFAAIAMSKGKLELFSLIPSIRLIGSFDSKDNAIINDISFNNDNSVLVSIDNSIQVLTIND